MRDGDGATKSIPRSGTRPKAEAIPREGSSAIYEFGFTNYDLLGGKRWQAGEGGREALGWPETDRSPCLVEDDGFVFVDEDAVFQLPADGLGEGHLF